MLYPLNRFIMQIIILNLYPSLEQILVYKKKKFQNDTIQSPDTQKHIRTFNTRHELKYQNFE